ncbi:calmodulin-like protein 6 isoform X1 [Punica granatum]|uniref:Calmodulin-like protein 6 isoform X1 n=3 Tax=Punica granatum TaxID=22663 RepID=A0A6P8BNI1_PUNGR|nr:calmodulin-like protein 6 isoform X1 [Punica granatum]
MMNCNLYRHLETERREEKERDRIELARQEFLIMGVTGACTRLLKNLGGYAFGFWQPGLDGLDLSPGNEPVKMTLQTDDLTVRALRDVFGMEPDGSIKTERARRIVQKLGLIVLQKEEEGLNDEVRAEEVLGGIDDVKERSRLLKEAFEIFDEDGNGFIEAAELKRVLECLGLDKGWDMGEIEKMVRVVDLNLDGKVDFIEFESMMAM